MRNKPIHVSDLKDQIGKPGPHPCLYCPRCGETFSANAGDYWAVDPNRVLKHCGSNMRLVIKRVIFEPVAI